MGLSTLPSGKAFPLGLPVGTIQPWPTAVAPDGWQLCDGSALSRSVYSDLFSTIGTTFGVGDGSTTFNVPSIPLISTPWAQPRGRVGSAQITSSVSGIGSAADVSGLSIAFTAVANRYYRVTFQGYVGSTNANAGIVVYVTNGANTSLQNAVCTPLSNVVGEFVSIVTQPLTFSAGAQTVKIRAEFAVAGTATLVASATRPCFIMLEDIGGDVSQAPFTLGAHIIKVRDVAGGIDSGSNYVVTTSGALPTGIVGRTVYTTDDHKLQVFAGATPTLRPPWNLPWGIQGIATTSSGQAGVTSSGADLTGLSVTFTAVANRRYRITGYVCLLKNTSAGLMRFLITDGSNTQLRLALLYAPTSGTYYNIHTSVVHTPAAGSFTYKLRASSDTNTMDVAHGTDPGFILVEDIGPNGSPA